MVEVRQATLGRDGRPAVHVRSAKIRMEPLEMSCYKKTLQIYLIDTIIYSYYTHSSFCTHRKGMLLGRTNHSFPGTGQN